MENQVKEKPEHKKKDRKKIIAIIAFALILPVLLTIGAVAAYFSDFTEKSGQITAGRLKINGAYQVLINGTEVVGDVNVTNFNPGDVVVINGTITNAGNKSAWIRERVAFNFSNPGFANYVKIYTGAQTQEDLLTNVNLTEFEIALAGDAAVSDNKIIDGTGQDAETEGEGGAFIGSNTYNFSYTIYFSHLAGNDVQGENFTFSLITQALQYRNNNAAAPDEAAWATVTAAPPIAG